MVGDNAGIPRTICGGRSDVSMFTGLASGTASPCAAFCCPAVSPTSESPLKVEGTFCISSASSTVMHIGCPTGTSFDPSGTSIFARKPSSRLSNSSVALSVSISHNTSPTSILSPSFFLHLAIFP
nr:hypothetical protein Iba_chr11aCG14470 [Ipomoea batatas]GMD52722.1 hypothetical protein Iba_chr11bCG14360 [Ipomoea batatas]GMD54456.1 hypothetical protein Iba_chr11cCG12290 [Ipomoea batatas]GMD57263.1 hypothetical protein Iba_chr11eCG11070 [Ipomoea batatas]GMD58886.1 hypothetical protein Iba_chr11fCG9870 [Ipomoea batatas]